MIIYRIEKSKYKDVWPSRGALYAEGRWNRPGQWIVYCSETVALGKLEILANSGSLPIDRVIVTVDIAENAPIYHLPGKLLPVLWWQIPYPDILSDITGEFLNDNSYLAMRVPSAQSRKEFNYLLNPAHKDFNSLVKVVSVEPEIFDVRLKPK